MTQIFLSYLPPQKLLAHQLASVLEAFDYSCPWLQRNVLKAGHLERTIARADVVVVFATSYSADKKITRGEVTFARDKGIPIIPILLEPTFVPAQPHWNGLLNRAVSVDAEDPEHLDQLSERLLEQLEFIDQGRQARGMAQAEAFAEDGVERCFNLAPDAPPIRAQVGELVDAYRKVGDVSRLFETIQAQAKSAAREPAASPLSLRKDKLIAEIRRVLALTAAERAAVERRIETTLDQIGTFSTRTTEGVVDWARPLRRDFSYGFGLAWNVNLFGVEALEGASRVEVEATNAVSEAMASLQENAKADIVYDYCVAKEVEAERARQAAHERNERVLQELGYEALADYLVKETVKTYKKNAIEVDERTIAASIFELLSRVEVVDPGDTGLAKGQRLDALEFNEINRRALRPATARPLLLVTLEGRKPGEYAPLEPSDVVIVDDKSQTMGGRLVVKGKAQSSHDFVGLSAGGQVGTGPHDQRRDRPN